MSALRLAVLLAALATLVIAAPPTTAVAQNRAASPAAAAKPWAPPRTPWGDPDLQGIYTNKDESGIPMEKPDNLSAKAPDDVEDSEFADDRPGAKQADGGTRAAGRRHHRGGSDALVRELRREEQPAMADRRSADGKIPSPRPRTRRSVPLHALPSAREADAGRPTRGPTAASTTAASRAACPAR